MHTFTVMVGLPGTGKSTRVTVLLEENPGAFLYSTDKYIESCAKMNGMTYDEAFQEFIDPATSHMNSMLDVAIRSRQDVIWDQTNLGAKKRGKIIRRAKNAGYQVYCECIRPPFSDEDIDVWIQRLNGRPGKTISDYVMSKMMESYVKPTVDEGFDRVTIFDLNQNIVEKEGY